MKVLLTLLIMTLAGITPVFSQLHIQEETRAENITVKNQLTTVLSNRKGIVMNCVDIRSSIPIEMVLGKDKTSARKTVEDLINWAQSKAKNEYAKIVDAAGTSLTIYKATDSKIYISPADGEYIRQEHKRMIVEILGESHS